MSAPTRACDRCLRRGWLLAALAVPLDYACRDRARMLAALELEDAVLIDALGGSRCRELKAAYARSGPEQWGPGAGLEAICFHDEAYPRGLRYPAAPHALQVAGGLAKLERLAAAPAVAIVGSRRASDYGAQVATCLARGLAASGVTVAATLTDGIARAALAGALEGGPGALCVSAAGLSAALRGRHGALLKRITRAGCAVAELPGSAPARSGAQAAAERTLAGIACVVIVVEAQQLTREIAAAQLARSLGRRVAAVPGRVTSPLAAGPIALLRDGATLVRDAGDVLDLLALAEVSPRPARERRAGRRGSPLAGLEPRLRRVLVRVGAGSDTPEKLLAEGERLADVLPALSELELLGLLARGDGGRYLPRVPLGNL